MPLTRKIRTPHQRTYVTLTRALQALCTLLKCFPHTVHLSTCIALSILQLCREMCQALLIVFSIYCVVVSFTTHTCSQTDMYTPKMFSTHGPLGHLHFTFDFTIFQRDINTCFACAIVSCSTHMWLQTDLYTPQKFSTHNPFRKTSTSGIEIFSIILLHM